MLKPLKKALVTSYVGAIALGWIFAQAILHFAFIFSAPVANWLERRPLREVLDHARTDFSFQDALPEVAKSLVLLLVGYFLLRWLYYKPLEPNPALPAANEN